MTIDGGRVVVKLEGKDVNLSQLVTKLEQTMVKGKVTTNDYLRTMDQLPPHLKRAEQETVAYATALARLEALQGRAARGQQILASAIQTITPNTVSGVNAINNLQNQMNKYELQAERARQKTLSFATSAVTGFNQLIGAAFAVQGVVSVFSDIIQAGNQLEKTDVTVRALAGSQEKYNEVLTIAKRQQDLYGGSLQENLENLSGFIYTANQAGVAVDELANIARRLAIVDPAQGFKGASIALKEFFSGEITSLARRFEIPRELLNNINELGSQAEKLKALDEVLNNMGLTQELLTSQAETTAVTYDKLTGSFQDAFATVGQGIAQTLEPLALSLITVFQAVADGIEILNQANDSLMGLNVTITEQTRNYKAYSDRVEAVNENMRQQMGIFGFLAPQIEALTPALYEYAEGLRAGGVGMAESVQRAEELRGAYQQISISAAIANVAVTEGSQKAHDYIQAGIKLTDTLNDGGTQMLAYAAQVEAGTMSAQDAALAMEIAAKTVDEWTAKTAFFNEMQAAAKAATEQATMSIFDENRELEDGIIKKGVAAVATQELAAQEAYLTSLADGVVAGQLSVGQAALQMAGELGVAKDEAYELINALAQLAFARQQLALQKEADASGIKGMPADRVALDNLKAYRKVYAEQTKVREAEKKYNFEQANTADQLRIKQNELAKYTEGTEDYWKTLGEVKRLEKQVESEREKADKKGKGGGKGSKAKKTEAQKENEDRLKDEKKLREQLLDVQADFAEKMEDAELEHVEKIAEIYEDFYADLRKQERENEIGKRRSRFDFYEGLDPESGIDTTMFAAQYEEAFTEAQRIAQEGKAALSQEFLELRQSQIEEMMDLEKKMADIRADKDLSKGEKAQRLAYLEGLKKLLQDAQDEELKALLEGGDDALNALDERLSEEERRYAEQTQKIAIEAGRQADEKVLAAERGREAILKENEALQAQYDLIKDISATGARPTLPASAPLPIPPSSRPIPVETTATNADGNPVTQVDLWRVHDDVLNSTFLAVGARLETQLVNIITSIENSRDAITNGLRNVETIVGRLGQSSLVQR